MTKPDNVICEDGVCRVVSPEEAAAHKVEQANGTANGDASSPLLKLLGPVLQRGTSEEVSTSTLTSPGKVIGLYSSAHWCGPCRAFTPQLATFYNNFKANHANKEDFEIIFNSLDRDDSSFTEYFATMPWLAVPFKERGLKDALCRKFKVSGIPSLIILDGATGEVINGSGDDLVQEDPEGAKFPWRPQPFSSLLGDHLVDKAGRHFPTSEALDGKVKMVYFSAHWCPPCRGFTPELAQTYAALKKAGRNVEVIFVSSDRSEAGFQEYLGEMPWLALPYQERDAKMALSRLFAVTGIPTLVVLDENDQVITSNGRSAVARDPEGRDFPWLPKPLDFMDDNSVSAVNEAPVLVLLLAGEEQDREKEKAHGILYKVAEAEQAAKGEVRFLWGLQSHGITTRIVSFLKESAALTLGEGEELLLLNLPEERVYQWTPPTAGATPTAADAEKFLAAFKAGSLTGAALR